MGGSDGRLRSLTLPAISGGCHNASASFWRSATQCPIECRLVGDASSHEDETHHDLLVGQPRRVVPLTP